MPADGVEGRTALRAARDTKHGEHGGQRHAHCLSAHEKRDLFLRAEWVDSGLESPPRRDYPPTYVPKSDRPH